MANRTKYKQSVSERRSRRFSDNFKIEKVRELEKGKVSISELVQQYEVSSTNIYRWLRKFGTNQTKKERVIVEIDSDTKQLLELKKKVAELERIIGQKQVLLDFKDKMIDLAEQTYGVDIKKKYSTEQSNSTGINENP
jgi:transposase-like protein